MKIPSGAGTTHIPSELDSIPPSIGTRMVPSGMPSID